MHDWASLGLGLRSTEHRSYGNDGFSCREELRLLLDQSLVASHQTTIRISAGEQVLSTNTQFIQRSDLNMIQIRRINEWLRERANAAAWRLTSYTI